MKIKRKARSVLNKKFDILKPISIESLGTKDDPCFGKHYDIKAEECQRCGDCELCSIVVSQNNHIARAKVEKAGNFKDLEVHEEVDKKTLRKKMRLRVKELTKDTEREIEYVVDDLRASYSKFGTSVKSIRAFIGKLKEKGLLNTVSKTKIKWKV